MTEPRPHVLAVHASADRYGSDLQFLESVRAFEKRGWRCLVVLPGHGWSTDGLASRVTVLRFVVLRKALLRPHQLVFAVVAMFVDVIRAVRLIRRERPSVLYVNTITVPQWLLAGRLARITVVAHVHEAETGISRALQVGLNAPLLLADRIIANSGASARLVSDALPRLAGRTRLIYNGVPDHGPVESKTDRTVVFVGRLAPRKGIDVLLDAVAIVRRTAPHVRVLVCGTTFPGYEWYEAALRARAEEPDLSGSVEFAGYVRPVADAFQRATICVVPSRVEPLGNVAIEAQLAGLPVIASAVGGLVEIVDSTSGVLVEPDDPGMLAAAVQALLDDPARRAALGRAGRESASVRFGLDRYGEELCAVCEVRS